MTTRLYVTPAVLFFASAWGSAFLWLIAPDSLLQMMMVNQKAELSLIVQLLLISSVAFLFGSLIPVNIPKREPDLVNYQTILKIVKLINVVAGFAFVFLLLNTMRVHGVGSVKNWIAGQTDMAHIEGITTFSHASTAAFILAATVKLRSVNMPKKIGSEYTVQLLIAFSICFARGVFNGERLALLIPLFATFSVFLITKNHRIRILHFFMPILAVAFVFAIFMISESTRSYKVKSERAIIDSNLFTYSYERLLLYYVVSVNSGVHEYALKKEGIDTVPLFSSTLGPFSKIINVTPIGRLIREARNEPLYDYTTMEGMRSKELTNRWGVSAPFVESFSFGCIYWLVWGWVSMSLFRLSTYSRNNVFYLSAYGVVSAGLLDVGRVLVLGSVHILVPLFILIFIHIIIVKRPLMLR